MLNIWKLITLGNPFSPGKNFSVKLKMRAIMEKTVRFPDAAKIKKKTLRDFS
jgi:hypothetical protein